jgi:hypothetical protein
VSETRLKILNRVSNLSTDVSGKTKHWIICMTTWRNSTPGRREPMRARVRSSPNRRPTPPLFAANGRKSEIVVETASPAQLLVASYPSFVLLIRLWHVSPYPESIFSRLTGPLRDESGMLYACINRCMSRGRNYILVDSIRIFITTTYQKIKGDTSW